MRRRKRTTQGSPPTQEHRVICLQVFRCHALQAALTKPLLFSPQIFMEHPQGARHPQWGRGAGKYMLHPVLQEEKPSVDSASEADRRHRCRVRRTCREEQVTRAAGSGDRIWRTCGIRVGP